MSINRAGIFYDNLAEQAVITATSEALSVQNVKTIQPSEKWRSANTSDQTLLFSFADTVFIPFIYIERHNFTADAQVRVRISNNADLSLPTYDATFWAFPSITGSDMGGSDMGGADGAPVVDELEAWQFHTSILLNLLFEGMVAAATAGSMTLPEIMTKSTGEAEYTERADDFYNGMQISITGGTGSGQTRRVTSYNGTTLTALIDSAWLVTPDATSSFTIDVSDPISSAANDGNYNGLYVGLTISDPGNTDNYLEAGWIGLGDILQPAIDMSVGAEFGVVDPSPRRLSWGQEIWVSLSNKYRTAAVSFDYLSEDEAKNEMLRLSSRAGSSKPVVIIPFMENSFRSFTDTIYGLLDAPPRIRHVREGAAGANYSATLTIRSL